MAYPSPPNVTFKQTGLRSTSSGARGTQQQDPCTTHANESCTQGSSCLSSARMPGCTLAVLSDGREHRQGGTEDVWDVDSLATSQSKEPAEFSTLFLKSCQNHPDWRISLSAYRSRENPVSRVSPPQLQQQPVRARTWVPCAGMLHWQQQGLKLPPLPLP
jgi:hypothetical protein